MNITITINMDGAAFGEADWDVDARTTEVARILMLYANDIVNCGAVLCDDGWTQSLYDVNGNTVGTVLITSQTVELHPSK